MNSTLTAPTGKPLLDTIAGHVTTRRPIWIMRQAGRYLPEYRAVRAEAGSFLDLCFDVERATEVTLQPIRRYGFDAAILFSDILVVPWALGQHLAFQEGEGPKLDALEYEADFRKLASRIDLDRLSPVYAAVRAIKASLSSETTLIGFAGAPWTLATYMIEGGSSRDFARSLAWQDKTPDSFARLIGLLVDAVTDHLSAQIGAGAEIVQIFDSWAGALTGDAYRRWCIEPTAEIVRRLRAAHPLVPVIGFPRASTNANYAAYAEATGVDVVSLDQAIDPTWAGQHLAPRVAVQGNLDPALLVAGGVRLAEGIERILTALKGTRHVFNLGHGVVPETPPEHVAELVRLVRSAGQG